MGDERTCMNSLLIQRSYEDVREEDDLVRKKIKISISNIIFGNGNLCLIKKAKDLKIVLLD